MKPVPTAWLADDAEDMLVFDARVRATHDPTVLPANTAAYQQWHYAVGPDLLRLVNHWHATRQCVHLEMTDLCHDTDDGVLERGHGQLRFRHVSAHSERYLNYNDRRWHTTTLRREVKRDGNHRVFEVWRDAPYVDYERVFEREFGIPRAEPRDQHRHPMEYCEVGTDASQEVQRYQPHRESNPRWWIQERRPLCATRTTLELVVEADPVARGWDSDEDEVIEYDKPDPVPIADADKIDYSKMDETPPEIAWQIAHREECRACRRGNFLLTKLKDGRGYLRADLPRPVIWGRQVRIECDD